MSTLWLRFADDSGLPDRLTVADQEQLLAVFSTTTTSRWIAAVHSLGITPRRIDMVTFHHGTAYINWTAMTEIMTGGMMTPVKADAGFSYQSSRSPLKFWRFLANQWKISSYLAKTLSAPIPQDNDRQIEESLALGIALLTLTPRLPKHTPQELGLWLSDLDHAPPQARKTLLQIQNLQIRRTSLSGAWKKIIQGDKNPSVQNNLPEFFWDTPPLAQAPTTAVKKDENITTWKGIPVVKGTHTGKAFIIRHASPEDMADPALLKGQILVFPRARPETVSFFDYAAAIVYAEGGTLSHACTVAREQKIICVTGLGASFIANVKDGDILKVDGTAGTVEICNSTADAL